MTLERFSGEMMCKVRDWRCALGSDTDVYSSWEEPEQDTEKLEGWAACQATASAYHKLEGRQLSSSNTVWRMLHCNGCSNTALHDIGAVGVERTTSLCKTGSASVE